MKINLDLRWTCRQYFCTSQKYKFCQLNSKATLNGFITLTSYQQRLIWPVLGGNAIIQLFSECKTIHSLLIPTIKNNYTIPTQWNILNLPLILTVHLLYPFVYVYCGPLRSSKNSEWLYSKGNNHFVNISTTLLRFNMFFYTPTYYIWLWVQIFIILCHFYL